MSASNVVESLGKLNTDQAVINCSKDTMQGRLFHVF